jgi:hypothetical protein
MYCIWLLVVLTVHKGYSVNFIMFDICLKCIETVTTTYIGTVALRVVTSSLGPLKAGARKNFCLL